MLFPAERFSVDMADMSGTKLKATPRSQYRHFVREWREAKGLKQDQLAELISLTPGAVSQLENGTVGYSQRNLEAIALVFGCTPADLLEGPPGANREFLALWRRIAPEHRQMALEVLRPFARQQKTGLIEQEDVDEQPLIVSESRQTDHKKR